MKKLLGLAFAAACLFGAGSLLAEEKTPLLPLQDVRVGMQGYWRTVVRGTEVAEFPLEVIGVAKNFVGPGRSVIICQAVDAENLLSGPVSGMSGSPVYIDGKLLGAYAYGFMWAKEQAIIGVTPIADMLEVFERFGEEEMRPGGGRFIEPIAQTEEAAGPMAGDSGRMPSAELLRSHLQPLPMAVGISGISPAVLAQFEDQFRELGLEPTLVPMGQTDREIDTELRPGSAVAGVMLDGDFSIAGTGTVTYRDGDRILAFGHPFLGMGATNMPMAVAEVMTVVRAVPGAFKLSSTGPVVGAIYQDRLSAIAGRIGAEAPVTRLTVTVRDDYGFARIYRGNLFKHPQLSPTISTMALLQTLTQTMEASLEQTFFLRSEWDIEGFEPIVVEDVASGPNSPRRLGSQHLAFYNRLMNNPFEIPNVNAVTYDIAFRNEWLISQLESAFIDRRRVRGGDTVTVDLVSRGYRGETTRHQVEVPIPSGLAADGLTLFIGDAAGAAQFDPLRTVRPASLGQVVDEVRRHQGRHAIYVKLLRRVSGLTIEGQSLPNLLPSVAASLRSPQGQVSMGGISFATVWETRIPVDAEFQGRQTFQLELE